MHSTSVATTSAVSGSGEQNGNASAQFRGWYAAPSSSPSEAILRDAYQNAKAMLMKDISISEAKELGLDTAHSVDDVKKVLLDCKSKYDAKPMSKAQKWLGIFSAKLMFYAPVLDVLAQHHPEYTSLVWGTMRFLFMAVSNHDEMVRQLSKACTYIAEVLPRTELTLILYPTERIREAVSHVYARIMAFMLYAVRWYKKGKLGHAWSAIAKPWALSFKDHVEEIGERARRVDELSNGAAKAELRDMHQQVLQTREEVKNTHRQIELLTEFIKTKFSQMQQLEMTTQSIQTRIQVDLSSSTSMISNIQLGQILSLSFMERLPTSGESLYYCQSMQHRRRGRSRMLLPDTRTMEQWSAQPKSFFLVAHCNSNPIAKDFLVDLVGIIRQHEIPLLWALRFPSYWERPMTAVDILRMLVLQALQINPQALSKGTNPLTVAHLREAADERDWLAILNRALVDVPQVFIVIDADLLSHAVERNRYSATRLLEMIPQVVQSVLKIVVSSSMFDESYAFRYWDPASWSRLRIETTNNIWETRARNRRLRRAGKRNAAARLHGWNG